MVTGKQRTAKPRVSQCRTVSVEADALSRRLQSELGCSANQLAELAIFALAEAQRLQQKRLFERDARQIERELAEAQRRRQEHPAA